MQYLPKVPPENQAERPHLKDLESLQVERTEKVTEGKGNAAN